MSNGAAAILLPKLLLGISAPNTPIAGDGTASVSLPALSLEATDYYASLPAFTLEASGVGGTTTDGTNVEKDLPAYTLIASGVTEVSGSASISLPVFSISAYSDSFAAFSLPKLSISGSGLNGTNGTFNRQIPALLLSAFSSTENLGSANIRTGALVIVAEGDGGTSGSLARTLAKYGITANGESGTDGTSAFSLPSFTLATEGAANSLGTATITLPALQLLANGYASNDNDTYNIYTLNTNTAGLTSYSNFNFNSMTMFNGTALAAGDGGIYALSGTLDDTADITSNISLGIFDFDSAQLKRVHELYFNYRSNGDLTVTVTLDDNEQYLYELDATGVDGIYNNRLKLGRGLKARHWQISIEGVGADFELNSIATEPIPLSRRL